MTRLPGEVVADASATHVYHGPEVAHLILKDGCARCLAHAEAPWFSLDRERAIELTRIALAWEDPVPYEAREPGSTAERLACRNILDLLNGVRALAQYPTRAAVVDALGIVEEPDPRP